MKAVPASGCTFSSEESRNNLDESPIELTLRGRTGPAGRCKRIAGPTFWYLFGTAKKKAPDVSAKCLISLPNLVGANGLEPSTPTMSRWESGTF